MMFCLTQHCNILYIENFLLSHLLSALLLLLALVALMAQLVSHFPARLRLLLQLVGHGFCLVLQLPLLLENKQTKKGEGEEAC